MGYGVGKDDGRWVGYMVPAECDTPECKAMIDHGLGYKCETHYLVFENEDGDDEERTDEGCGLFFCEEHLYLTDRHEDPAVIGKDTHPRWAWWVLNHHSWGTWREENPREVAHMQELVKDFKPDAELLEELADTD